MAPRQVDLDRVQDMLHARLALARMIQATMADPNWPPMLREAAWHLRFNAWNDLARWSYLNIVWC